MDGDYGEVKAMDMLLNAETQRSIHYRVLVLDESSSRAEELEISFLTPFTDKGESLRQHPAFRKCKRAAYFFVQSPDQLCDLPSAAGFNMIWMHLEFPGASRLAQQFYRENPFCHLVLYGGRGGREVLDCLHGRPVGYVADIRSQDAVHGEMAYLYDQQEVEGGTLRLVSRDSFYDIPLRSLLYCQIFGRKTCFVMDSIPYAEEIRKRIPFVSPDSSTDFMSYEMNIQLDEVEKRLSEHGFLRIHKSYLVNRRAVTGLSARRDAWLIFVQGHTAQPIGIPVSERYRSSVREVLAWDKIPGSAGNFVVC